MTRLMTTTALILLAPPAHAHVGHVGELAGHDHWIAGIAIGAAAGLAIWGALKGRKDPEAEPQAEAEEDDPQEEPA